MASESTSGDKSEKPTSHKLKRTREQGQVVRSRDLATAIGILVTLRVFVLLVPGYLVDCRSLFFLGFAPLDGEGALDNAWSVMFSTTMMLLLKMVAPLFIVPVAAVIGGLLPGGWVITTQHWMPKLERLSPAKNLGKLFTGRHVFDVCAAVAKAAALGGVLWYVTRSGFSSFLELQKQPFVEAAAGGAALMLDGVMAMCAIFIVFALIDVPAQVFFFMKGQRMSKQEVKEEHKTNEGRPEIKQRVRQLQHQMARRSVRKAVPTADVVVVNPEHYAVALKYDEHRAEAPYVVAKGVDEMALYIREVAAAHGIETVPLPPLARAIYHTSQVNQQIPMVLYRAVAQVLTYVLQIKAFRSGRRKAEPELPMDLGVPRHLSEMATT
jgi:flagellar biosynthesis protein FlhB